MLYLFILDNFFLTRLLVAIHNQELAVGLPNQSWVTGITYVRAHESWPYLAAVMDLFLRRSIGWPMQSRITRELALDALLRRFRVENQRLMCDPFGSGKPIH